MRHFSIMIFQPPGREKRRVIFPFFSERDGLFFFSHSWLNTAVNVDLRPSAISESRRTPKRLKRAAERRRESSRNFGGAIKETERRKEKKKNRQRPVTDERGPRWRWNIKETICSKAERRIKKRAGSQSCRRVNGVQQGVSRGQLQCERPKKKKWRQLRILRGASVSFPLAVKVNKNKNKNACKTASQL